MNNRKAQRIKMHPELGILVCDNGQVFRPGHHYPGALTFGFKRDARRATEGCYMGVRINGKTYSIHRLVAETFIPNPEGKPTVDHIDGNRSNNCVENLRWATTAEQNENHPMVKNRLRLGVRRCEDTVEYLRRWRNLKRKTKHA